MDLACYWEMIKDNCAFLLSTQLGKTALMLAAQEGHEDICTLLADRGVDLELTDVVGLGLLAARE